jgi:hypothetical protein
VTEKTSSTVLCLSAKQTLLLIVFFPKGQSSLPSGLFTYASYVIPGFLQSSALDSFHQFFSSTSASTFITGIFFSSSNLSALLPVPP